MGLTGESKVSDKYTSAGRGSLPLSPDTNSPEHLLDPAVGPVSSWIMCPSDISAKMTLIYTWSLFLEHRQNVVAEKALSFLSFFLSFFRSTSFDVFLAVVSKYKKERIKKKTFCFAKLPNLGLFKLFFDMLTQTALHNSAVLKINALIGYLTLVLCWKSIASFGLPGRKWLAF